MGVTLLTKTLANAHVCFIFLTICICYSQKKYTITWQWIAYHEIFVFAVSKSALRVSIYFGGYFEGPKIWISLIFIIYSDLACDQVPYKLIST